MAKSAILNALPEERRLTIYHEEDGKTYVESRQDCSHIIKAASILADEPPGKDFRHVGFIPETVMDQWMRDGSFNDPNVLKRWLNDPQNAPFRTWKGRV